MKIIFLDYDGVLTANPNDTTYALDPTIVQIHLSNILNDTSTEDDPTKIVCISTWRKDQDEQTAYRKCIKPLIHAGLNQYSHIHEDWRTKDLEGQDEDMTRGDEVDEWLFRHPEVTNYVIIDDEGIGSYKEHHRLVQTDTYQGMTFEDALLATILLNDKTQENQEKDIQFLHNLYTTYLPKRLNHNLNQLKGVMKNVER
jgi:hypothetical protein